jgi:biotin-dependent carboxylase-like uncharacterized protein
MSRMCVHSPGLFTTVQDLGRPGFGPMGVSASGAADPISLRLGNRLVGNPPNAGCLEMTLIGGEFSFPDGALFALTGADFAATLDGTPVARWESLQAQPGQTLRLEATRDHARGYLCVAGGFVVELFLNSASTHVLSGLGGMEGRPLRKGDELQIGSELAPPRKRTISARMVERLRPSKILRVTAGPQSDWFDDAARQVFYSNTYQVTEEANRMGLRLQGAPVLAPAKRHMITEGVPLGAVQIPQSGQPIILFVEQQTTGGYPKIANVIAAHMPNVGQLRPRDQIRFELVDLETARSLLIEQERLLNAKDLIEEAAEDWR